MKTSILTLIMIFAGMVLAQNNTGPVSGNNNSLINTFQLKDTTQKVAWREEVFDSKLKQTVNSMVINESYFAGVTDAEKAALGYLATFIGNECRQDGNNVQCKILAALNLSYQCSETNKEFLKKWFANEPDLIAEIEACKTSSTAQSTFDRITVITRDDVIKVKYSAMSADVKDNKFEQWTEELTFSVSGDKLDLVKRIKKMKK